MAISPRSLAQIAESSGFGMADVAFLAGLDESTVCRLWDAPDWLDRVKGRTLQALVAALPGVGEYVLGYSLADRRSRLAERLNLRGVEVDTATFGRLASERRVPEQYLSNALETAACVLDGDAKRAAAHLARFWGRDQDYAMGAVFGSTAIGALLIDARPLHAAALGMADELGARPNSFHAILAQANLLHHLSLSTGETPRALPPDLNRNTALAYRSSTMGCLISTNNPEIALGYSRKVEGSPLLKMIEEWAFPTYCHDVKPSQDFSLPRSLLMRQTAPEIIREIETYNDAYLLYLTLTALPTILGRDGTFGLRRDELRARLAARRERVVLPETGAACDAILSELGKDDRELGGSKFEYAW